jgi:hypothetical protein
MNFSRFSLPRFSAPSALVVAAACLFHSAPAIAVDVSGAGWIQYGRIGNSSDPDFGPDFDGSSLYSSGAQLSAKTKLTEMMDGVAGLGVAYGHGLASGISNNGGYAPSYLAPYVSEAHFTYNYVKEEDRGLFLRAGLFPYDYNPEVQNLGLYLLRGPLYPGVLISGFEMKHVLPVATILGLQLHHQSGGFEHDLLINSDIEFFPYFDLSPAYVAGYKFGPAFRIGAGVNFYHLISITDSLTSGLWDRSSSSFIDTTGPVPDTVLMGFSGTKLMLNAAFDPKAMMGGNGPFGAEDLKLYGEVGLFGINNSSAYKQAFGDMLHRMPMMFGFNVPMFTLLDRLALEVEWYGSPVKDDLAGFNHTAGSHPNPLPLKDANGRFINHKRDNWKWSLYGSRVIQNHIKVSFQVANDHFRPGIYTGDGDNNAPGSQSLMTTPKDWYTMLKVAYFF